MTRDQELWGMALWVERQHGTEAGDAFIADRIDHFSNARDEGGVDLWSAVAERFNKLQLSSQPPS